MPKLINYTVGGNPFMVAGIKFFPGVPVTVSDATLAAIMKKRPNLAETPLRDVNNIPAAVEVVNVPVPVSAPVIIQSPEVNPTEQAVAAASFQRPANKGGRPKKGSRK